MSLPHEQRYVVPNIFYKPDLKKATEQAELLAALPDADHVPAALPEALAAAPKPYSFLNHFDQTDEVESASSFAKLGRKFDVPPPPLTVYFRGHRSFPFHSSQPETSLGSEELGSGTTSSGGAAPGDANPPPSHADSGTLALDDPLRHLHALHPHSKQAMLALAEDYIAEFVEQLSGQIVVFAAELFEEEQAEEHTLKLFDALFRRGIHKGLHPKTHKLIETLDALVDVLVYKLDAFGFEELELYGMWCG